MPYTGTVPSASLAVGAGLPALWTQQVGNSLSALESAWTSYTPIIAGTGWSFGSGASLGRYIEIGHYITGDVLITSGTGATFGAGTLTFSLPVAASASHLVSVVPVNLVHGGVSYAAVCQIGAGNTTSSAIVTMNSAGASNISSTVPFTWAVGDSIRASFTYEGA